MDVHVDLPTLFVLLILARPLGDLLAWLLSALAQQLMHCVRLVLVALLVAALLAWASQRPELFDAMASTRQGWTVSMTWWRDFVALVWPQSSSSSSSTNTTVDDLWPTFWNRTWTRLSWR